MNDRQLPRSLERDLPATLAAVNESIATLARLGLVTEYPDGTIGVAEAHLRAAAVAAAQAAIAK